MENSLDLGDDFKEFIACFIARDVRFLIVGGYALAAHGHPRATGDLDAWVLVSPENAGNVVDALRDFGFASLELTAADFLVDDVVVQLGYPPFRIDILTSIDGVDFESAWPHRYSVAIAGLEVPFIGRRDLVANKRAAGRKQDLADVEALGGSDKD